MQPSRDIRRLIDIMAALRDPIHGCPWDIEQTFASIAPFTVEEAYEVADAIERGGTEDLREERRQRQRNSVQRALSRHEAARESRESRFRL